MDGGGTGKIDNRTAQRQPKDDSPARRRRSVESAIRNYEMAYRMQSLAHFV